MANLTSLRSPRVSVDVNFLVDCADGQETALRAWEMISERLLNPQLFIMPTAVQEIAFKATADESLTTRQRFYSAASWAAKFGFVPINLIPVGHGIVEQCARLLREKLMPQREVNDSLILAESSLAQCHLLISSDAHLVELKHSDLRTILDGFGTTPIIASPRKIVTLFESVSN